MKKIISLPVFLIASALFSIYADAKPTYEMTVIASDNPDAPHLRFQGLNDKGQVLGTAYEVDSVPYPCDAEACIQIMVEGLGEHRAQLWQAGGFKKYGSTTTGLGLNNKGDVLLRHPLEYRLYTKKGKKTISAINNPGENFYLDRLLDNGVVIGSSREQLYRSILFSSTPYDGINSNPVIRDGSVSNIFIDAEVCRDLPAFMSFVEWDGANIKKRKVSMPPAAFIDSNKNGQILVGRVGGQIGCLEDDKLSGKVAIINPDNSVRYVKIPSSSENYAGKDRYSSAAVAINNRGDVLFVDGVVVLANGLVVNAAKQVSSGMSPGSKIRIAADFNDQGYIVFREVVVANKVYIPEYSPSLNQMIEPRSGLVLYVPGEGLRYFKYKVNESVMNDFRFLFGNLYPAKKPLINDRGDIAFSCGISTEKICYLRNKSVHSGNIFEDISLSGCVSKKAYRSVGFSSDAGRFDLKRKSGDLAYSGIFKSVFPNLIYSLAVSKNTTDSIAEYLGEIAENSCKIENVSSGSRIAIYDKENSKLHILLSFKVSYLKSGIRSHGDYNVKSIVNVDGQSLE